MKLLLIKLLIFAGQHFFFVRGKLRNILIRAVRSIINYKIDNNPLNTRIKSSVNGVPFYFYFDALSEVKQVFGNYNKKEIDFLKKKMKSGSVFVDIGSNVGFYSQNIASIFPKIKFSKILSIEPNYILVNRHKDNIDLLSKKIRGIENKIFIENYAVGEFSQDIYLNLKEGYGSASIVTQPDDNSVRVKMKPLIEILTKNQIQFITCLKIDIEGYEDQALIPFFKHAPKTLYPQHIVLETGHSGWENKDLVKFIVNYGYVQKFKTRGNLCLSLQDE